MSGSVSATTVIAGASLALAAAGTVASAVGQAQQGEQQARMAQYNQQIQYQRARDLQSQAEAQAAIEKNQSDRKVGQIGAAYGASGVDADQGTPLEVMADSAAQGELQRQLTIWGGRVGVGNAVTQGNIDAIQGGNALTNSTYGAGSTLLTGALKTGVAAKSLYDSTGTGNVPGGTRIPPFGGTLQY